jgi:hypothetical protein
MFPVEGAAQVSNPLPENRPEGLIEVNLCTGWEVCVAGLREPFPAICNVPNI